MRNRKSTHSVYNVQYHIVWTPRYRRKILVGGIKKYLERMIANLAGLDKDIEVRKVNVQPDHVHMVIVIPPRVSVASVVKYMKSKTGKIMNKKWDIVKQIMRKQGGLWSRGYFVSSVGINEKIIMNYVEYQEKEDKGQLELEC